jgi:hypothetical protein
MIPRPYIAKWQQHAPWKEFAQVEQDLIISRALVEIFSDEFLRENLALRGGTALHKQSSNSIPAIITEGFGRNTKKALYQTIVPR